MVHQFSRNELAIGREGLNILRNSTVAILGVGGVGSFAAEALARTGVGRLILVDRDDISITNINRQIHSLMSTIGMEKVDVMRERIKDINPNCEVICLKMFYTEETYQQFFQEEIDFVIDASDTIIYKIHIIKECLRREIPFISSMGAAYKMDPTRIKVADLFKTSYDPIAKVMRSKLRKEGITRGVPVVYSDEQPLEIDEEVRRSIVTKEQEEGSIRKVKIPPPSNAFVPSVFGLTMASYVVSSLLDLGIYHIPHSIPVKKKGKDHAKV